MRGDKEEGREGIGMKRRPGRKEGEEGGEGWEGK